MADQIKVNQIQKQLGSLLFKEGIRHLQSAFKVTTPIEASYGEIKNIFVENGLSIPLHQYDTTYFLTDWQSWKVLFEHLLIDQVKYLAEKLDCDNFANLVSSLAALIMLLNTCGTGYGFVSNVSTGAVVGNHYFNLVVTKDREVYLYDALKGHTKIEKNKPVIVGDWKYTINSVTLF